MTLINDARSENSSAAFGAGSSGCAGYGGGGVEGLAIAGDVARVPAGAGLHPVFCFWSGGIQGCPAPEMEVKGAVVWPAVSGRAATAALAACSSPTGGGGSQRASGVDPVVSGGLASGLSFFLWNMAHAGGGGCAGYLQ